MSDPATDEFIMYSRPEIVTGTPFTDQSLEHRLWQLRYSELDESAPPEVEIADFGFVDGDSFEICSQRYTTSYSLIAYKLST